MLHSIRFRLGAGMAVGLLVVIALQWLAVTAAMRGVAEDYARSRLDHDIDNLLAGLSFDAGGRPRLAEQTLPGVWRQPFSGHYFQITAADTVLRSRSLWDRSLLPVKLGSGETDRLYVPGPDGQSLLLLSRGFLKQQRAVTVSVAEDMTALEAELRHFRRRYALVSLVVVLLLLGIQALIVRASLQPLDKIRRELQRLGHGDISRLDEDAPREISPLVTELNRLLGTLNRRLLRSRQALANLAHAIKTPLSVLSNLATHADLRAHGALRQQLETQTGAIQRLVERELKHARLAGAAVAGQRFLPAADIPALIQTLHAIHRERSLHIDARYPPDLALQADREDMLELLGNLLDNACKWARGQVRLTIAGGAQIRIVVEDDGPGCPPEECARLAQRGVRLDETIAGHGLGLAITRDIVASYDGHIAFGKSADLGGMQVDVVFPDPGVRPVSAPAPG